MPVTIEGCGQKLVCESGGFCAEWDDGPCDVGCSPGEPSFETAIPTPLAPGSRKLARLTVRHMRRGAIRQLLGGAVAEVERDQEFLDLMLQDVSVAEVVALLEQ